MKTSILGKEVVSPICVASSAYHKLAHPDGERATARACANTQTVFKLSTFSSVTLEEVSLAAPDLSLKIF